MSTFTLPSRQTFSFSPALRPVLLSFPLLRYHFPPHSALFSCRSLSCAIIFPSPPAMFSCLSLSYAIIFPLPSALFSYLSRLACPHYSFPTLCFVFLSSCLSRLVCSHSFCPCILSPFPPFSILSFRSFFLSLSSSLFRPSPFFPLRIFSPFSILSFILFSFILIHRFFFFPHLPHFLFPFRPCIRLAFSVPLSRLSLSFHTHTLTPLSPLFLLYSPSSRLSFSLFFHIHRPFFRASRCPSLQKQSCRTFLYGTKKRKAAASRFLIATIC